MEGATAGFTGGTGGVFFAGGARITGMVMAGSGNMIATIQRSGLEYEFGLSGDSPQLAEALESAFWGMAGLGTGHLMQKGLSNVPVSDIVKEIASEITNEIAVRLGQSYLDNYSLPSYHHSGSFLNTGVSADNTSVRVPAMNYQRVQWLGNRDNPVLKSKR